MTNPRRPSQQLLLEAAEHVLVEDGAQALTTRSVAARAGVPNGLVHYHLGSVDAMLRALTERVGSRLVSRHRSLFEAPEPFAERWRSAVAATAGDPTWAAWTRLRALSLSRPGMEVTVAVIDREWRDVLADAADRAVAELELPAAMAEPLASLTATLLHGLAADHLAGTGDGHDVLLRWADGLVTALHERQPAGV